MRLMKPDNIDDLNLSDFGKPEEYHLSYQVKVITPIYGGGVKAGEPDTDMPIRASAIKGQLRYWWRFLQSNHIEDKNKQLKGTDLFIKERDIWGGMGDESEKEKGKDFSSKVFIKVETPNIDTLNIAPCCEYKSFTNKRGYSDYRLNFLHDIPQYAMFPGQGKSPKATNYDAKNDRPHKVILPDFEFILHITATNKITDEDWKDIQETIKWWANFGGIGARTRRGLGSIYIQDLIVTRKELEEYSCTMKELNSKDPIKAWNTSIEKLHQFRQGVNIGRNQKKDENDNLVTYGKGVPAQGGSRWPEPDSIREIANQSSNRHSPTHPARLSFPRAVFGLPIIFKFNDSDMRDGDPEQSELRPINSERMTSPLILKAMCVDGSYKAIALKLPTTHFEALKLEIKGRNTKPDHLSTEKKQEWSNKKWKEWQSDWWAKEKAVDVQPISLNNGTDALEAFMNYFGGK